VLQQILSIGGAVSHFSDHTNQFVVEIMDSKIDAGTFSNFGDSCSICFLVLATTSSMRAGEYVRL
jgi:hypothetical protein